MEFKIQRSEFLRGLRIAQSIADRKSTMPMLANVLLRIGAKTKLLVAATDLNVSLSAELSAKNSGDGGITVGAKALYDIVSNMPGDDIVFRRGENNWAEIKSGKVDYRLVGMSDRDFPKVPDYREVTFNTIDGRILREMIDKTLFSICNDETRFHLNGVLFESDGAKALMVSTDGHRLSKVSRTLEGAPSLTAGIIIPKKGVVEIKRLLDGDVTNCELGVKTPYIFVKAADITLAVKLIEAQFPPYEQVIPKESNRRLVVDRIVLLDALKRAQLMASETRGVKLAVDSGMLRISSDNPDVGEVKEELEGDFTGDPVAIGFNPKYVIEILSHMDTDKVAVQLNGELDPGLIVPVDGGDYVGVVMPMRI